MIDYQWGFADDDIPRSMLALNIAIEALNTIGEIENIINQPNIYEDVLKYKMICKLVEESKT